MSGFSIGEVELITGVKAHILRYWEDVISSFSPSLDVGGHRIYTQRDVDTIRRLKFLIYKNGLTVEKAWDKIIEESSFYSNNEVLVSIRKCRFELNQAYSGLKILKKRIMAKSSGQETKGKE